jgi:hypothetical protein
VHFHEASATRLKGAAPASKRAKNKKPGMNLRALFQRNLPVSLIFRDVPGDHKLVTRIGLGYCDGKAVFGSPILEEFDPFLAGSGQLGLTLFDHFLDNFEPFLVGSTRFRQRDRTGKQQGTHHGNDDFLHIFALFRRQFSPPAADLATSMPTSGNAQLDCETG